MLAKVIEGSVKCLAFRKNTAGSQHREVKIAAEVFLPKSTPGPISDCLVSLSVATILGAEIL